MSKTKAIRNLIIPVAVVAFFGCAHMENVNEAPRERLIQRVNEYWDAKIKGQVEKAYSIENPEARKKTSVYRYAKTVSIPQQVSGRVVVRLVSFKILSVDLEEDSATVDIQHKMKIATFATKEEHLAKSKIQGKTDTTAPARLAEVKVSKKDKWVKLQGEWYHDFKYSRSIADAIIKSIKKRKQQKLPVESQ